MERFCTRCRTAFLRCLGCDVKFCPECQGEHRCRKEEQREAKETGDGPQFNVGVYIDQD